MIYSSEHNPLPGAAILRFPRRRGRPRKLRPESDTGTPELVMKRLKRETAETLDLCLERDLITADQHWCGVHLRWLYTLRHGAPGVRAVDTTHLGGMEIKSEDPQWRSAREREYLLAVRTLAETNHAVAVTNVCIHNERLRGAHALEKFREGLDVLSELWRR